MLRSLAARLSGPFANERAVRQREARKPPGLIYATGDIPPPATTIVLGIQHAVESASKVTLPIAVLSTVGVSGAQLDTMIVATLIVSGLASILVSSRLPVVGFGHLLPAAIFSSFVAPAVMVARMGGLRLLCGMTLVSGLSVALFARVLPRWRFLFPAEVVGLIAFMVGASQSSLAVTRFLGMDRLDQTPSAAHILVATASLSLLAGLTVWSKGRLRLFSTLITLVAGYAVCIFLGMVKPQFWQRVHDAPWIGLPEFSHPGFAFDPRLLLPFVVLGLSSALKTSGDLTICEKISDADWKRTDMRKGSAAVVCMGLGSLLSGLLGGFALGSSSSNVGLSAATGAVSRQIGYACGAALIVLAFFPKFIALIAAAPPPVVGAMFLLVVSYNLIAGMQIIMSRMMEVRHTYIIGVSLLFGLTADVIPGAFQDLPEWLRTLLSSGLTLATVMVLVLNLVFRIGTSKRHSISLEPATSDVEKIYDFMEESGSQWGARREVVERAVSALVETYELISGQELTHGTITAEAGFDEFSLDITVRYPGRLPEAPGALLLDLGERDAAKMASMLVYRLADRVRLRTSGLDCEIELHFEH
ncbi:MAG: solute carrier family 23 protein [Bryobacteraceae bacterium]